MHECAGTHRHTRIHLKLFCTADLQFHACKHQTPTHTKQSISHTNLILNVRNLWDPIHPPLILHFCVCFHGAALYELEREPSYWDAQARATLDAALKLRPREHQAKNLILFLGDGRSCYVYGIYSSKHSTLTWLWLKFEKATTFSLNDKYGSICNARQCSSVFSYCTGVFAVLRMDHWRRAAWTAVCGSADVCLDLWGLMSK